MKLNIRLILAARAWAPPALPNGQGSHIKHVLIALALRAGPDCSCFPGVDTLASDTGAHRTAVIRALAWLEAHELVVSERRHTTGGRRTSDRRRLQVPGYTPATPRQSRAVRLTPKSRRDAPKSRRVAPKSRGATRSITSELSSERAVVSPDGEKQLHTPDGTPLEAAPLAGKTKDPDPPPPPETRATVRQPDPPTAGRESACREEGGASPTVNVNPLRRLVEAQQKAAEEAEARRLRELRERQEAQHAYQAGLARALASGIEPEAGEDTAAWIARVAR